MPSPFGPASPDRLPVFLSHPLFPLAPSGISGHSLVCLGVADVGLPVPPPCGAPSVPCSMEEPASAHFHGTRLWQLRGLSCVSLEKATVSLWGGWAGGRTRKHILGQVCLHGSPLFLFMYLFVCLFEWGDGWLLQSSHIVKSEITGVS